MQSVSLVVEAELVDMGLPAPPPGIVYVISIMRYRVLKVLRGTYQHPFVFVGHDQPDPTSPQFQVGDHHRLHLTRDFPEHATTLNKFEAETRDTGIFFCASFEVIT